MVMIPRTRWIDRPPAVMQSAEALADAAVLARDTYSPAEITVGDVLLGVLAIPFIPFGLLAGCPPDREPLKFLPNDTGSGTDVPPFPTKEDSREGSAEVAGIEGVVGGDADGGNDADNLPTDLEVSAGEADVVGSEAVVDGDTADGAIAVDQFVKLGGGQSHTCAHFQGALKCWGSNSDGELGNGTTEGTSVPIAIEGLVANVTQLAVGFVRTCAVLANGAVYCWGDNDDGLLGDGTVGDKLYPTAVQGFTGGVSQVAVGFRHSCALQTDGAVQCWGTNPFGAIGDGTTENQPFPTTVKDLGGVVVQLTAGHHYTCGVLSNGSVQCWGANAHGTLGDGTKADKQLPVMVEGLAEGVTQVVAGWTNTCALSVSGGVQCWGKNTGEQLEDGTIEDTVYPTTLQGFGGEVLQLAKQLSVTCALIVDGTVRCWGGNGYGQLGDGSTEAQFAPVEVVGLADMVGHVAVGGYHACAGHVNTAGTVQCWGWNNAGQLGDGTKEDKSTPTFVQFAIKGSD